MFIGRSLSLICHKYFSLCVPTFPPSTTTKYSLPFILFFHCFKYKGIRKVSLVFYTLIWGFSLKPDLYRNKKGSVRPSICLTVSYKRDLVISSFFWNLTVLIRFSKVFSVWCGVKESFEVNNTYWYFNFVHNICSSWFFFLDPKNV